MASSSGAIILSPFAPTGQAPFLAEAPDERLKTAFLAYDWAEETTVLNRTQRPYLLTKVGLLTVEANFLLKMFPKVDNLGPLVCKLNDARDTVFIVGARGLVDVGKYFLHQGYLN